MKRSFVLSWLGIILLTGCVAVPTMSAPKARPTELRQTALRKVRLPAGYIPSVQFASLYVAMDKGYFAEEGLELELDYSFETNGVQLVGANQLQFAVVSGEQVLLARAQGLPVVYVAAWFQKFPVALISRAEAGIRSPADLKGRIIGSPTLQGASFVGLQALLATVGVSPEEVTIIDVGFNQAAALQSGQADVVVVYANNEPIRLVAQGERLSVIQVSDYAALAANGLLTNETTIAHEPELVSGMVRALVRGIGAVIADPEGAYAVCKKYVETLTDDEVEKRVLAATIELWKADRLGYAERAAWENMHKTLLATGLLSAPVEWEKAYTNDFVP